MGCSHGLHPIFRYFKGLVRTWQLNILQKFNQIGPVDAHIVADVGNRYVVAIVMADILLGFLIAAFVRGMFQMR